MYHLVVLCQITYMWALGDSINLLLEEFSDDALSAHESELDRLRGYYADNADVYSLVEKRESKWNEKLDIEVSEGGEGGVREGDLCLVSLHIRRFNSMTLMSSTTEVASYLH